MSMKASSEIPPHVLAEAAEWFAVLGSATVSQAEKAQWQAWLAAHPDHQAAWAKVEFFTQQFKALPADAAARALNSPDLYRRQALKTLAVLSALGLSSWRFSKSALYLNWTADYQSALGETSTIALSDGSKVILDSASAFNVAYTPELRRLQLLAGEIYIETATDNNDFARPLVVDTLEGRIRALGTRFSVSEQGGATTVKVFEDAVEIQPAARPELTQILRAGQNCRFTREQIDAPNKHPADRPAWTQGMLLADNLPLSEFLLQLNRYRHGYLTCAPEIAHLRIVGAFPLNDTDRILATLEQTLPVKVSRALPLWVRVVPR